MAPWTIDNLHGPDGEDWRVPVSELESRITDFSNHLADAEIAAALIQSPVDLYYYAGGRQNGALLIPAIDSAASSEQGGDGATFFVRRSVERAKFESGGGDSCLDIQQFPSLRSFAEKLSKMGIDGGLGLQHGEIPADLSQKFSSVLAPLGPVKDCTEIVHRQREKKSNWELAMMREGANVQRQMFDAVKQSVELGATELQLVAAAEEVSRRHGFGGTVQMRRFPLQCDRAVIVSGRAGGIPSFFD